MSSEQELRCNLEANLRLAAELRQRVGQVRSILEKELFEHLSFSKPDLINLWRRELIGFRCNLNGGFSVPTNTGELEGEYNLTLSGGGLESYRREISVLLLNCEIRVRGLVSGFGPVDFELVPVSMIKTLDLESLHELQKKITKAEFLLKTIGLLPEDLC